jgi:putative intracellular protease/amidase
MVLDQQKKTPVDMKLLGMQEGTIEMQMGTQVQSTAVLDDTLYGLLYVPGGVGAGDASKDAQILETVRRHHAAGKIIATNCSGIAILHRAGILGDNPVTCIAAITRRLREEGENVPQPRRMWLGLPDQKLWTAVGASGVHGSTVAIIAHYWGREVGIPISMMFDTYGALGDQIFDLQGPEYYFHPELEAEFQGIWEDELLPKWCDHAKVAH